MRRSFLEMLSGGQKRRKTSEENSDEDRPPIDFIIDIVIGLLEHSTAYTRVLANQCFSQLSSLITRSTVDLILMVRPSISMWYRDVT